jgi:hypothetical protein
VLGEQYKLDGTGGDFQITTVHLADDGSMIFACKVMYGEDVC